MAKRKNITYRDLGFDSFGMSPIETGQQMSANLSDYVLDAAGVSSRNVKDLKTEKLTSGVMTAITQLGDESIVLNGETKEIIIYDSSGNPSIYMKGGSAT